MSGIGPPIRRFAAVFLVHCSTIQLHPAKLCIRNIIGAYVADHAYDFDAFLGTAGSESLVRRFPANCCHSAFGSTFAKGAARTVHFACSCSSALHAE